MKSHVSKLLGSLQISFKVAISSSLKCSASSLFASWKTSEEGSVDAMISASCKARSSVLFSVTLFFLVLLTTSIRPPLSCSKPSGCVHVTAHNRKHAHHLSSRATGNERGLLSCRGIAGNNAERGHLLTKNTVAPAYYEGLFCPKLERCDKYLAPVLLTIDLYSIIEH
jgi:hypothetical protein